MKYFTIGFSYYENTRGFGVSFVIDPFLKKDYIRNIRLFYFLQLNNNFWIVLMVNFMQVDAMEQTSLHIPTT